MASHRIISYVGLAASLAACHGELTTGGGGGGDRPDGGGAPVYRPTIQDDLEVAGCVAGACHGGDTAPMPLVAAPMSDDDWRDNYGQVMARAGTASTSLLIDKATGVGGHVAVLADDPLTLSRWRDWIAAGTPYQPTSASTDASVATGADAAVTADADTATLSWDDDIAPIMVDRCQRCHGNSGAYSLETWAAAFGYGSDGVPNIIPGDESSLLVRYCEDGHQGLPYGDALLVLSWVVDFDARER